jgi:hypothetical protein
VELFASASLPAFDNPCRTRITNGQRIHQATLCAEKAFSTSPLLGPAKAFDLCAPKKAEEEDLPLVAQRFRVNFISALLCRVFRDP